MNATPMPRRPAPPRFDASSMAGRPAGPDRGATESRTTTRATSRPRREPRRRQRSRSTRPSPTADVADTGRRTPPNRRRPRTAEPAQHAETRAPPAGRAVASASRAEVIGGRPAARGHGVGRAGAVRRHRRLERVRRQPGQPTSSRWCSRPPCSLPLARVLLRHQRARRSAAGTSIGYLGYQGPRRHAVLRGRRSYDPTFPPNMVFIAILLAAAWFMFRRGSPAAA